MICRARKNLASNTGCRAVEVWDTEGLCIATRRMIAGCPERSSNYGGLVADKLINTVDRAARSTAMLSRASGR
jgi:hypothetical protein